MLLFLTIAPHYITMLIATHTINYQSLQPHLCDLHFYLRCGKRGRQIMKHVTLIWYGLTALAKISLPAPEADKLQDSLTNCSSC